MKRCIFIGQAMPRYKNHPHDWPSLNLWLNQISISDKQIKQSFYYSALVDYFPGTKNGGHRVPTETEIKQERERLRQTILKFNPEIIVPVGRLSISHCLNDFKISLEEIIGKVFFADPYGLADHQLPIVPLPHPSGASTWHKKPAHKQLLFLALRSLQTLLEC